MTNHPDATDRPSRPRKARVIDTTTGEDVKIAAPVLPDGRVLVQRPNGDLAVIFVDQLTIHDGQETR